MLNGHTDPTPAAFRPAAVLAAAFAYARLVNAGCGTRSIVAFVHGDSAHVCRAESWKKPGRVIGNVFEIVAQAQAVSS
jgi:hypothetical protein